MTTPVSTTPADSPLLSREVFSPSSSDSPKNLSLKEKWMQTAEKIKKKAAQLLAPDPIKEKEASYQELLANMF